MFDSLATPGRKLNKLSLLASVALHTAALALLIHRAMPVFVMPSDVALGLPSSSGSVVYLAPVGVGKSELPQEKPKLALHRDSTLKPPQSLPKPATVKDDNARDSGQLEATMHAGSLYGSRIPGAPLTGHEIIPALPQVFPDPNVTGDDLPPGVQGDVVVEVTIDERGNVIELKLIRGIGYGIEDRVLATLRQWRFRPASKDGVTIASQHIVTFHYPG
jgi:TonB family protein